MQHLFVVGRVVQERQSCASCMG